MMTLGRPPHRARGGHDLLIRRTGRTVQGCLLSAACWADVPHLSSCIDCWLHAWQQCWQQSSTCLQIAVIGREAGAELVGGLAVSACDVPPAPGANGTLMARRAVARITGDLHITRVFSRVARRFKACPGFMFAGCCWWRSLAVDGSSGTSRGHGCVMRRLGFLGGDAAVERPSVFQAWRNPVRR